MNIFNRKKPWQEQVAKQEHLDHELVPLALQSPKVKSRLEVLFDNLTFKTIEGSLIWSEDLVKTDLGDHYPSNLKYLRYFVNGARFFIKDYGVFLAIEDQWDTGKGRWVCECPPELIEAVRTQIKQREDIEESKRKDKNLEELKYDIEIILKAKGI